ncbi:MAG: ribosomal protein S18-alanine N-acetyltransferase [Anaerolineae bacterium]|nr:ribosomal protein S18-alanine N-acetyltransferase [Anaerolineae bacterium]MCX8067831.1 ribosomal protein S18-alanine N-acetyltransferase [Anaerolineae bacterium]MDW7990777.1 ribosomal protein S18-alanine N-acetyltransferase [Anaerolineae bacterium]
MARFVVRPMREEDLPETMEIERRSFRSPWPESAYRHELRYGVDSQFYVLQLETEKPATWWERAKGKWKSAGRPPILGYIGMRFHSGTAHIATFAIHPDWRGRGLGKYLLLVALEKAIAAGARTITLEVRVSNRVAQKLYTDVGFQRIGLYRGYYRDGEDAWTMALGPLGEEEITRLQKMRKAIEAEWEDRSGAQSPESEA